MPLEREPRVVGVHPAAVVRDREPPDPAPLDLHVDARRPGVEGVLDELLDDRRRPLDDLARGDLVDQDVRENRDPRHGAGE